MASNLTQNNKLDMDETNVITTEDTSQNDTNEKDAGKLVTDEEGFENTLEGLPKGYYRSTGFIGTVFAIGLGFWAGNAGLTYAAPVLPIINASLGPDPNVQWVALVHPVGLSVGMTIVGRLGDIFGRRWFFIGGAFLALVGSLVSALAVNMNMLIFGAMIKAIAASTQLSVYYAMGELLPAKYRYFLIGAMNAFQIPGSAFAPAVSNSFIRMTGTWRSVFYLLTALNGTSMLLYFFFYHPPNFHQKQGMQQKRIYFIKNFDYVGAFLYATGLVFFLLGLSWGGSKYPWHSAYVISFIIIGGVSLISFIIWECYAPLKEPLIPIELLKNRYWVVSTLLCGIGAGVFYAGAIIWPTLVTNFYARGNVMRGAYLACLSGSGITAGGTFGGLVAKSIGYQKWQATFTMLIGGALLATVSTATPDNEAQACALFFFALFFIGWNTDLALGNAILSITDQRTIGAAGGAATSGRTTVAAVCQAVYGLVLANQKAKFVPASVIPAVTAAGLPGSSVKSLLSALAVGNAKALAAVPGLTPAIKAVAIRANQMGLAQSYRTVWLVSLAFTGLGVILGLLSPNTEKKLTNQVAATLQNETKKEETRGDDSV